MRAWPPGRRGTWRVPPGRGCRSCCRGTPPPGVPPVGRSARWCSKSPTTAWTRMPAYSRDTAAAASRSVCSLTSNGTKRSRVPASRSASSRIRVFSDVPGAQLDQRVGLGQLGDVARVGEQDAAFGAGRVVLGEAGDLVEQLAPAVVVEPLRRQRLRHRAEALRGRRWPARAPPPRVAGARRRRRPRSWGSLHSAVVHVPWPVIGDERVVRDVGPSRRSRRSAPTPAPTHGARSEFPTRVPWTALPSVRSRLSRPVVMARTSRTTRASASSGPAPSSRFCSTSAKSTSVSVSPTTDASRSARTPRGARRRRRRGTRARCR